MPRTVNFPQHTSILMTWQPEDIVTRLCDRVAPYFGVEERSYLYRKYPIELFYQIPDSKVGPTGQINNVSWGMGQDSGTVQDYALKTRIPGYDTYTPSAKALNLEQTALSIIMNALSLDREKRVADATFNFNNFPASQRTTLIGEQKWSHPDSDPIKMIRAARRAMLVKPNQFVVGEDVWGQLESHPKVVSAALGNDGTSGVCSPERFSKIIGFPVLIGDAIGSAQRPSEDPARNGLLQVEKLWGNGAALLYTSPLAANSVITPPTWMATARLDNIRFSDQWEVKDDGTLGSTRIKAGEFVEERIFANACGYFFNLPIEE